MTDIIEASSISHMPQLIDIYSASWGPTDNGKTVDGPRELTLQAMADGVNKVRSFLRQEALSHTRGGGLRGVGGGGGGVKSGGGADRWCRLSTARGRAAVEVGLLPCALAQVLREMDPKLG